jgi:hypothetical protein
MRYLWPCTERAKLVPHSLYLNNVGPHYMYPGEKLFAFARRLPIYRGSVKVNVSWFSHKIILLSSSHHQKSYDEI